MSKRRTARAGRHRAKADTVKLLLSAEYINLMLKIKVLSMKMEGGLL